MIGAVVRQVVGYVALSVIAIGLALCVGSALTSAAQQVHALLRGAGLL